MNKSNPVWLRAAFMLSFFSVGIPFWIIPYNKVNLPSSLIGPGLIIVVIAALLLRASATAPFWKTVRIIGSTLAAAVLTRVIVEGIQDPSSHNLWPFEIIIALALGFSCSFTGAAIGSLIARLRGEADSSPEGGQA